MSFIHKITGTVANIPWSVEESNALGYARYMDDGGCKACGQPHVGRYISNNECVNCALRDAAEVWKLWKMGSPDRPEPFPLSSAQAVDAGVDYFYRESLCKGGKHFVQPHIKTGRCVVCESARRKQSSSATTIMREIPDMVISKESASVLGFDVFRTGGPCRRGHVGWRYVSNGGCIECMRGRMPTFEPIDMTRLVTIVEQMQLFIGCAWDGRRIVDPDGRKYTVAQFNIMFGGPGRYEVSDNRPDVFTSHEAFMRNFGPLRNAK